MFKLPPKPKKPRRPPAIPLLALDRDKLGLIGGAFFATLVMAVGFYANVSAASVAYRTVVAFMVAYVVTFLVVHFLIHLAFTELTEEIEEAEAPSEGIETEPQQGDSGETA